MSEEEKPEQTPSDRRGEKPKQDDIKKDVDPPDKKSE